MIKTLIKLYRLPYRDLKHRPPEYKVTVTATQNVMLHNADYQVRVVRNKLLLCSKFFIVVKKRHDWQKSGTISQGTYLDLRNIGL
jgi:hypothetical protein